MKQETSVSEFPHEVVAEATRQYNILSRSAEKIYPEANNETPDGLMQKLLEAINENRPLKVKFGMDPTAPDIHLGHSVVLGTLQKFQDLGHTAMLLIGDYTTLIGDPSGRDKTRPPLTEEQIKENAKTYLDQAFKVLKDDATLDLRHNSDWLGKLSFAETIKLCAQVTVSQIIQRDSFANRLEKNIPVSMHELLYPIMQGYDSVAMECDIELGGTDQTFNCLMGRQLMHAKGMKVQAVMTFPLLVGLDGVEKMSKSKNNTIAVEDSPVEMFGKVMSTPDELLQNYFKLLTDVDLNTLPTHPMEAKKLLARNIITRFHDAAAAQMAEEDFTTRFSKREVPEDLPEVTITCDGAEMGLPRLLAAVNFTTSNSEGVRLIAQNAVKINGEAVTDQKYAHPAGGEPFVLQAGKRRMARVTLVAQ